MRSNLCLLLLLALCSCGTAMLAVSRAGMLPMQTPAFLLASPELNAGLDIRTTHGQDGHATITEAERVLAQAERQPASSRALVRRAAKLAPAQACPSLQTAMTQPTRAHLAQARREMAACARAMSLETARAETPLARRPHDVLQSVLRRGEFQMVHSPSQPFWLHWLEDRWNWLLQQRARIYDAILSLWHRLFGRVRLPAWHGQPRWMTNLNDVLRQVLYIVLLAAVLFLLSLLVNRLLLRALQRTAPEARSELLDGVAPVTRKQEPSFWEHSLQEAEALWQQGEERKSLRTLYWACLVLLDARGVLRFDEGRANGEVLRELRRQGFTGVHDQLRPIVRSFDRSWYGMLHVSQEEFMQVLEYTRRFRGAVVKEP